MASSLALHPANTPALAQIKELADLYEQRLATYVKARGERAFARRRCRSKPDMPGNWISSTRHRARDAPSTASNASAESKVSDFQHALKRLPHPVIVLDHSHDPTAL